VLLVVNQNASQRSFIQAGYDVDMEVCRLVRQMKADGVDPMGPEMATYSNLLSFNHPCDLLSIAS